MIDSILQGTTASRRGQLCRGDCPRFENACRQQRASVTDGEQSSPGHGAEICCDARLFVIFLTACRDFWHQVIGVSAGWPVQVNFDLGIKDTTHYRKATS
jgi:hypothetical protein